MDCVVHGFAELETTEWLSLPLFTLSSHSVHSILTSNALIKVSQLLLPILSDSFSQFLQKCWLSGHTLEYNEQFSYDWATDFTFTFHFHALEKEIATHSCSCLKNPRNEGAWWAAIYEVAQSQTQLKRLSSSSSYSYCEFLHAKTHLFYYINLEKEESYNYYW